MIAKQSASGGGSTSFDDPGPDQRRAMHGLYHAGGAHRHKAPHVAYPDARCPHAGCDQRLQAIPFHREDHGQAAHDPLIRAWWEDTGFAGCCPSCGGWIHFTILGKRAMDDEQAARLPRLPENWHAGATILCGG